MAYGRDIVIRLPDASIGGDEVRQSLASFVTVLSVTTSLSDAATLHARLLSSTHVDHLLNVLSGKLRVRGFLCGFARLPDQDSEEEEEDDETLVEDPHGSFHEVFLSTPTKSSPISIPMMDQSCSVLLTPPQSLSQSTLSSSLESSPAGWPLAILSPSRQPTSIPIGLHPEMPVVDPSPYRPENRVPRRRVTELAEIYDRVAADGASRSESDGRFLPLAPPYHLLPNTPYFRKAPIEPPPLAPPVATQRVINRYLNSMKVMDNLAEMEVQSLMCFNFNRTVGYCPYTMPDKAPLQLRVPADRDDIIDEDWSIWNAALLDHEKPAAAAALERPTD